MKKLILIAIIASMILTACGPKPIAVEGIAVNASSIELEAGSTFQLIAAIIPADADNQEVLWESDAPEVAQVSQLGLVSALGNGTAVISVTGADGSAEATVLVTVTTAVTGISLDIDSLELKPGETYLLKATVVPETASDQEIVWSSDKHDIAGVDKTGLVTAKNPGSAVITATTKDGGKTVSATVTVSSPPKQKLTPVSPRGTADEMLMLDLVNEEREKAGLKPLKLNMDLTKVARLKSQDFIDNDYFAHESPVYGSPFDMMKEFGISYRYAAENLARHPSVESAHLGLMNSPGHRANILNQNLSEIGIGIKVNNGSYYITQMFIGF